MSPQAQSREGFDELAARSNLTHSQLRFWLGQAVRPDNPCYNMALAYRIDGAVDEDRFFAALRSVVANNDALRLRVRVEAGIPQAEYLDREQACSALKLCEFADLSNLSRLEIDEWLRARTQRVFTLDQQLFDCVLAPLPGGKTLWFFNQHHLATDATSTQLLQRQISEAYESGGAATTSAETPPFREYAEFERQQRVTDRLVASRRFWAEQPISPLVEFHGTSASQGLSTATRYERALNNAQSSALTELLQHPPVRSFSEELGTLNLFLVVYFAWIHRLTGQQAITLGLPLKNRSARQFKGTPGLFVETFPAQVSITSEDTVALLHAQVARLTAKMLAHANAGMSVHVPPNSFNCLLNMITASYGSFAGQHMHAEWILPGTAEPGQMLQLHVQRLNAEEQPVLLFDLCDDVFSPELAQWAMDQFLMVFEACVADLSGPSESSIPLRYVPLIGAREREFLRSMNVPLARGTNGHTGSRSAEASGQQTLLNLVNEQFAVSGADCAVRMHDLTLSYAELERRTDGVVAALREQLATGLVALADAEATPLVAVCFERSIDMVVGVLGVLRAGYAFVPVDPGLPSARIARLLADSGSSVVLTNAAIESAVRGAASAVPLLLLDEIESGGSAAPDMADPAATSLAYLLYTSGTTGRPKGVRISHRAIERYIIWARDCYAPDGPVSMPLFTSLSFDLTLTSLFLPLVTGGQVVVHPSTDSAADTALLDVFDDDCVDVIKLTPTHLSLVRHQPVTGERLRALILGGESLRWGLASAIHEKYDGRVAIYNEYGPTEATVGCMIHRFDPHAEQRGSVPVGRAVPHAQVYLLDSGGAQVPVGYPGDLHIGGASLALGYQGLDALTRERFVTLPDVHDGRLYKTGDIGRWCADGTMEFLGRRDSQVKVGGVRVELEEIESALGDVSGVLDGAVELLQQPAPDALPVAEHHCTHCGIADNHPVIQQFDDAGKCNLCRSYLGYREAAERYFGTVSELAGLLKREAPSASGVEVAQLQGAGYDALVMLGGDAASTYALCQLVDAGVRVLGFTVDTGFVTPSARDNINRTVAALGVPLIRARLQGLHDAMRRSLESSGTPCAGCSKAIWERAVQVAREHGVPRVVTGVSRARLFETRLHDFFDRGEFSTRIVNNLTLDGRGSLIATSGKESLVADRLEFVDFYRFCAATEQEILVELGEQAPWARFDEPYWSQSCELDVAGIHSHLTERGYHNYAGVLAWEARIGFNSRDRTMELLGEPPDSTRAKAGLDKIGFDSDWRLLSDRSKRLVAFYVADQELPGAVLREQLATVLPSNMVPTYFQRVARIPRSASGKMDRAALRLQFTISAASGDDHVAASGPTERLLVGIWSELLGQARVGVQDNFFDLGGDSILAIQVVQRLRELGVALLPSKLFENPTIAELAPYAELLDGSAAEQTPSAAPVTDEAFANSGLDAGALADVLGKLADR